MDAAKDLRAVAREEASTNSRIIDPATGEFPRFNEKSFSFRHALGEHALFTLPRLHLLAKRLVAQGHSNRVDCLVGDKGMQANWSDWKADTSELDYCFEHLREPAQSYVVIKQIQKDPEYSSLFEQVLEEFRSTLTPHLREEITWASGYLFIAAPGFSTPYHMDHETGVLLQVHGSKNLSLIHGGGAPVPTQEEREHYYMGNLDAAQCRPEFLDQATTYWMEPGTGVHLPVNAPHWVKNGDEYSVSLSVNFCLRQFDQFAKVHQANHILRKFGLNPRPPGQSAFRDRVKRVPLELISKRNPETMDEMLRSGVRRLNDVLMSGRTVVRRMRRRPGEENTHVASESQKDDATERPAAE